MAVVNESDPVSDRVLAVERHELEQLAEKVHHQHGWRLAESWRECVHDTCARIRSWLDLLSDAGDGDDFDPT